MAATERRGGLLRASGFDPLFVGATITLLLVGLVSIYSVNQAVPAIGAFKKQLLLLAIGAIPFSIFLLTPATIWNRLVNWLYALNLVMLTGVILKGSTAGGAQRWLDLGPIQFQPSEMSKIITVITLSVFFNRRRESLGEFSTFFLSFLHVLPTLLLVFLQPHLGATITIFVSWLAISLVATVPWKHIVLLLTTLVLGASIVGTTMLQPYQLERVRTLFSSQKDNQKEHYQQDQAMIAIGVGGTLGQGYLRGEQKERRAVPEQHNDFIFTVIGEEGGFFGSALVLLAFALFFGRGWFLSLQMGDLFGRMACIGVLSVLAFHWVVNMAMNLGIGPVVGLWLPFVSYGGTALWLCLSCVGLIINLNARAQEGVFSGGAAPQNWLDRSD
ncbi:MAG: rod shape-determining protein RodA [Chthonomonas sp.]|nr:rod shape-determining protein RodA [Chthonomonas sp.]